MVNGQIVNVIMLRQTLTYLFLLIVTATHAATTDDFDLALQMLADFTPYMSNQYQVIDDKNTLGESMATFKGENTFGNNEQGVRHNADLSMICAFLCKYAKGKVTLPSTVTWDKLAKMARTTLTYSYSTHKANRLYPCKNNQYWGSVSNVDHAWESSLWAMSVAYSAFFQWEQLSAKQREQIYNLLKAECNYELERTIPTGYQGDTKAEENGWECDVLAATIGLFPTDPLATNWFKRLREFAVNSYSHPMDADNDEVADPHFDQTTIAQLYKGPNLYDDFTLQNHNYFHTSYQNVVAQELGEAALALKLFQTDIHKQERWKTNTLMHQVGFVMDEVLNRLALADGELAMPNGNDWSLFLYDQITSFSTVSCFLRDPYALMLEQRALRQIAKRQKTTPDGSWLLRPDVGARRMGVEAHRVMMTWLMHHVLPTNDITPTTWEQFLARYSETGYYPDQDVITASSPQRFTCFSWSKGLKNYTGFFAPTSEEHNNIVVPFRTGNTGNYIGYYEVEGKKTDAIDVKHAIAYSDSNSYIVYGTLETNERTLRNRYMLFATGNNLVLYFDMTRTTRECTITKERGGLLAISTDPFTKTTRTLHPQPTTNGQWSIVNGQWVNIDNCVGVVVRNDKQANTIAFGDQQDNNSILTSKLYASYSDSPRTMGVGDKVDTRLIAYYSNITADQTKQLNQQVKPVTDLPTNWEGYQVNDTDGSLYLVLYNTTGKTDTRLNMEKITNTYHPNMTIILTVVDGEFVVLPMTGTSSNQS